MHSVSRRPIQDPTLVIILRSPGTTSFSRLTLRVSSYAIFSACGQADFEITLRKRAKRVLLDRIPSQ